MTNTIKYLKIKKWLDHYNIENYTINSDYTINVDGDVIVSYKNLTEFPDYIQFNKVVGNFYCDVNKLASLEGAPNRVDGNFYCDGNKLTSLEGAPTHVVGNFYCYGNKLTSLEGAPTHVGVDFNCRYNSVILKKPKNITITGKFINE